MSIIIDSVYINIDFFCQIIICLKGWFLSESQWKQTVNCGLKLLYVFTTWTSHDQHFTNLTQRNNYIIKSHPTSMKINYHNIILYHNIIIIVISSSLSPYIHISLYSYIYQPVIISVKPFSFPLYICSLKQSCTMARTRMSQRLEESSPRRSHSR